MWNTQTGRGQVLRAEQQLLLADAILDVTPEDGEWTDWVYHPETTEARAAAVQSRFDRLSRRLPSAVEVETDDDGAPRV